MKKLTIISDSPLFLLEKTLRKEKIELDSIYNFPYDINECHKVKNDTILLLLSEVFYKQFQKRDLSLSLLIRESSDIFASLYKIISILSQKSILIYIPLVPKHFLYSADIESDYFEID